MASPTELEEWCRASCAGYSSVEVRDWSRSFQSGLAFCAIIHKHRPELIDFSSLSKDNAYQNNKMALELAETKLGVFMLLDPGEMASAPEPDGLAVITCVFQFYFLFNRKSIDIVSALNSSAQSSQNPKSLTHLESTGKYFSSDTKPRVSCDLCFEPVHLIQRRVVDGKVYHRKCFRCRHCHLSLLPGAYTKGNSANSMICSHHVQPHSENSKQTDTCSYLSLSGLAISSVPHYPVKKEPPDEQWRTSVDGENGGSREKREAGIAPEDGENILGGDPERGRGAVPAPRRSVTSYGTSSSPNMSDPRTQGASHKTPGSAPVVTHVDSSAARGVRIRTSHPWLKIVHPGPWTQLPPAPPLVHPLRSKSVSSLSGVWYKPRTPAPNPFDEEEVDKTVPRIQDESEFEEVKEIIDTVNDSDQSTDTATRAQDLEVQTVSPISPTSATSATSASSDIPHEAQCHSEAAVSDNLEEHVPPSPQTGHTDSAQSDSAEESGPALPPQGFPLIKRKVRTDRSSSRDDLQQLMGQVSKHLEEVEEKGAELERDIRLCTNSEEEERLLMDWFCLVHQRHVLQRKDTELVHLMKQRELEQRQEDVEYHLRCVFNKPERDWTEDDKRQEQRLMDELLHIIEQRNQIISRLDQDVHRDREDDLNWTTLVKNKDVQKRELKELKKSKGKFKTTSVFKILNKKTK